MRSLFSISSVRLLRFQIASSNENVFINMWCEAHRSPRTIIYYRITFLECSERIEKRGEHALLQLHSNRRFLHRWSQVLACLRRSENHRSSESQRFVSWSFIRCCQRLFPPTMVLGSNAHSPTAGEWEQVSYFVPIETQRFYSFEESLESVRFGNMNKSELPSLCWKPTSLRKR
jgi:hypothetical protein